MRNMKKFLALVLAMLMVCSMAVMTTSAADAADYTDAAETLAALKIMKGNEKGDLMLENGVTRYQTALFFAQALTGKTDAAVWNAEKKSVSFADVIDYGTAIDYVAGLGIVKGRGNGVFGYNDAIIYQDMIVMAVRALGYETADMSYPYGHILAADKLGLLEGIDLVNYKAELKRGETAQLINNMLNTEIAVTDALTGKILYPGEVGLTDAILPTDAERVTLLEEAGFANGKIEGYVTNYVEADEDDEESYATVDVAGVTFKAADLGITDETAFASFLGRAVKVLVDCKADEFETLYADEEASVVVVNFADYTTVTNVGADTNVKYVVNTTDADKSYVALGNDKFNAKDYEGELYFWDDTTGWTRQAQGEWADLMNSFKYTTKDGYENVGTAGLNTYCTIEYRVVEVEDDKDIVEVLYTPFEFGQYIERELPYSVTGKDETFVVIGEYVENAVANLDEEMTNFKEYLLGGYAVNGNKVNKAKGEASLTVEVVGEAVQSGDFMFYAYNAKDNVLTVAKNCGTYETGRLTASSTKNETVKINGTNMEFGFAGIYDAFVAFDDMVDENTTLVKSIIDTLEAGKDNVKYIAVDGKIVYMVAYADGDEETASGNFAIITTDAEVVAELLGLTETKYANKLSNGLYIEDGYVVVAMKNLTTGAWELAKIGAVAAGEYVPAVVDNPETDEDESADSYYIDALVDGEFVNEIDVVTLAKYKDITNLSAANEDAFNKALEVIGSQIVAVAAEADGVYTIADVATENEDGTMFVDRFATEGGLTFNTVGRTNAIKATIDPEVEAARVSTKDDTVIIVVAANGVQYRVGVQSVKKNVEVEDATFWAASESLIVLSTAETVLSTWGTGSAISSDDCFYVVMPEFDVEYGTTDEEDVYTLTIAGLYDLKTLAAADALVIEDDYATIKAIADAVATGKVVTVIADVTTVTDMSIEAALATIYADDEYVAGKITAFSDNETIGFTVEEIVDEETVETVVVDAGNAQAAINVTVVTFDFTEFDWSDLTVSHVLVEYDENDGYDVVAEEVDGVEYYSYEINLNEQVAEMTEPEEGIISDFEIDMAGETIVAYDKDDEEVYFTVSYAAVAAYDAETETVNMYVVKVVEAADAPVVEAPEAE